MVVVAMELAVAQGEAHPHEAAGGQAHPVAGTRAGLFDDGDGVEHNETALGGGYRSKLANNPNKFIQGWAVGAEVYRNEGHLGDDESHWGTMFKFTFLTR